MSVLTEIQRLKNATASMKSAITAKGVTVPSAARISDLAQYILVIDNGQQYAMFAVTDDISQYSSTQFNDVYDRATNKWYKLNNLNQFEEYGVYGTSPDDTKYVGKLIIYNGNEYEWNGTDWTYLGQVTTQQDTYVYPKYYDQILYPTPPPTQVTFNTMNEATAYPYVYYGLFANINGSLYEYTSNEEWVSYTYSLRGTKTTNQAMTINVNGTEVSVTIIGQSGNNYDWGYAWDISTPITSISKGNSTDIVTVDLSNLNVSQLTSIGQNAFNNCTSLVSIDLPNSITSIGDSAFYRCFALNLTSLPSNLTSIGNSAFFACKRLNLTSLPSSVTSIGTNAFYSCDILNLTSLPSGLTTISKAAFQNCQSLAWTSIPSNSVTSIGQNAFAQCSSLAITSVPSSVTSIGKAAFQLCSSITSFTWPSNITTVSESVFSGCTSLTTINLPSTVTSIDKSAFYECTSLPSINIPSGVTSIGSSVFYGCTSLTTIDIPSGVTSINTSTFYRCTSLSSVTLRATTPPTLANNYVFNGCSSLTAIYVPAESVNAYKTATNWSAYASMIQAIPT